MQRKKLEDLNLLDDFLFTTMVTYPGIGEAFSRELLRIIFQRDFGKLKVTAQRIYPGDDTDKRGTRMDVVLEDDDAEELANASIIDVEPDQNSRKEAIRALPKRVRFYHAKIDSGSLESGESYGKLKNVIIIMITSYDPFGLNRMVYTIKNSCVEEPDMPYDDGAKTIFLYTRGTKGNPPEELRQLLEFMEHTQTSYAKSAALKNMLNMVGTVKKDSEVSIGYMKIFEREAMIREEGIEEGREESARLTAINFIKLGKVTLEEIASATGLPLETIKELEKEALQKA